MRKAPKYNCKNCGFRGASPNGLHEHYTEHPAHRVKQVYSSRKGRKQAPVIVSGPFAELNVLAGIFAQDIAEKKSTIIDLEKSLSRNKVELEKLQKALDVLVKAEKAESQPMRVASRSENAA